MNDNKRVSLHSEADLRKHAATILRRVNAGERSGLLFLLNPVLALEAAGFDLNADTRRHLLRGLRYGAKTKQRIRELEAKVNEIAGRPVNVRADAQVARLLFTDLKIARPTSDAVLTKSAKVPGAVTDTGWDPDLEPGPLRSDDLEAVRHAHAVVPLVIELRGILNGGWRFVDRQTFERVKAGATVTLLRGVRFRSDRSKAFLSSLSEGGR